ncbi:hypothetical protein UlMin_037199 [Ulmus minor]
METTVKDVTAKTVVKEKEAAKDDKKNKGKEEEVAVEVEPNTGIRFPVRLDDGKSLNCVGLLKHSVIGFKFNIYAFGIYGDNNKLKDLLKANFKKSLAKPTKEMYELVIDSDVGMMVNVVFVYSSFTVGKLRAGFEATLGGMVKKLNGGKKNDELVKRVMSQAKNDTEVTTGTVMEVSRLPGYVLRTKVAGEVVGRVESELLCRAYMHMYLGDTPVDKGAKEKFGVSLLSLF